MVGESEARHYPALLEALDSGGFSKDPDRAFDFGLDCILDGIRARASQRGAESPSARIGSHWTFSTVASGQCAQ
jgi:hypothetical protein